MYHEKHIPCPSSLTTMGMMVVKEEKNACEQDSCTTQNRHLSQIIFKNIQIIFKNIQIIFKNIQIIFGNIQTIFENIQIIFENIQIIFKNIYYTMHKCPAGNTHVNQS